MENPSENIYCYTAEGVGLMSEEVFTFHLKLSAAFLYTIFEHILRSLFRQNQNSPSGPIYLSLRVSKFCSHFCSCLLACFPFFPISTDQDTSSTTPYYPFPSSLSASPPASSQARTPHHLGTSIYPASQPS